MVDQWFIMLLPMIFDDECGVNHTFCGPIPVQPKDGITFVNKLVGNDIPPSYAGS